MSMNRRDFMKFAGKAAGIGAVAGAIGMLPTLAYAGRKKLTAPNNEKPYNEFIDAIGEHNALVAFREIGSSWNSGRTFTYQTKDIKVMGKEIGDVDSSVLSEEFGSIGFYLFENNGTQLWIPATAAGVYHLQKNDAETGYDSFMTGKPGLFNNHEEFKVWRDKENSERNSYQIFFDKEHFRKPDTKQKWNDISTFLTAKELPTDLMQKQEGRLVTIIGAGQEQGNLTNVHGILIRDFEAYNVEKTKPGKKEGERIHYFEKRPMFLGMTSAYDINTNRLGVTVNPAIPISQISKTNGGDGGNDPGSGDDSGGDGNSRGGEADGTSRGD